MERNGDDNIVEKELAVNEGDCEAPILNSSVFLDNFGEVLLTHDSDGLSWKPLTSFDDVTFLHFSFLNIHLIYLCSINTVFFILFSMNELEIIEFC